MDQSSEFGQENPRNPTIDEALDLVLTEFSSICACANCIAKRRIRRAVNDAQRLAGEILKIVYALDPECPDAYAYVDGHCSVAELVTRRVARLKAELESESL